MTASPRKRPTKATPAPPPDVPTEAEVVPMPTTVPEPPVDEVFELTSGLDQPSVESQLVMLEGEVQTLKRNELAMRATHRDLALKYNRAVERIRSQENTISDLRAQVENLRKP